MVCGVDAVSRNTAAPAHLMHRNFQPRKVPPLSLRFSVRDDMLFRYLAICTNHRRSSAYVPHLLSRRR
jgi:hypothetical protein